MEAGGMVIKKTLKHQRKNLKEQPLKSNCYFVHQKNTKTRPPTPTEDPKRRIEATGMGFATGIAFQVPVLQARRKKRSFWIGDGVDMMDFRDFWQVSGMFGRFLLSRRLVSLLHRALQSGELLLKVALGLLGVIDSEKLFAVP